MPVTAMTFYPRKTPVLDYQVARVQPEEKWTGKMVNSTSIG
jgi:hypothetical protein